MIVGLRKPHGSGDRADAGDAAQRREGVGVIPDSLVVCGLVHGSLGPAFTDANEAGDYHRRASDDQSGDDGSDVDDTDEAEEVVVVHACW